MEPIEFVTAWQSDVDHDPLIMFPTANATSAGLSDRSAAFLAQAGLPRGAAPFLSFASPEELSLPSMVTVYEMDEEFGRFRIIGSDGAGSPICIDAITDNIVLLDHELDFEAIYVNEFVDTLAETLLGYRNIVEQTVANHGEDAFLDNDIPPHLIDEFETNLLAIDSNACKPNAFWRKEIDRMRAGPYND